MSFFFLPFIFAATLKINKEIKGIKTIHLLPASFVCFQETGMIELWYS